MSAEEGKGQGGGSTGKRVCGGGGLQEQQHDLAGQGLGTWQ